MKTKIQKTIIHIKNEKYQLKYQLLINQIKVDMFVG